MSPALIDDLLPTAQFEERHERTVRGISQAQLFAAIEPGLREQDRFTRGAIALRELPARMLRRDIGAPMGFDTFAEIARDEPTEIVYGLVGRFWQLGYGLQRFNGAQAFAALAHEPRLALNVRIEPIDGGLRLSTRTRIQCPSPDLLRSFTPYWYLIRPVSGLIRQKLLKQIERHA